MARPNLLVLTAACCMGVAPLADAATTTTTSFTYDANGRTDLATDAAGTVTDYDFDARGLLTQRIDAKNDPAGNQRTTQIDWNATFAVPTERRIYNAAGTLVSKTDWTYNARGQPLTSSRFDLATTAPPRTTTTTYCEQADVTAGTCPQVGLVTKVDGPRTDISDVTTYAYYPSDDATCVSAPTNCPHRKGDLWKVTNALGQVTETLKYDGAGRVLSVKDLNGVITDMEYSPRGWLTARKVRGTDNTVETDDVITRYAYLPTGLIKQVTQPDGAYTTYAYDAAHRLTDIGDNAGNTIHYTLDNAGNRLSEDTKDTGAVLKRTLSRVYDQLGQLVTQIDAYQQTTGFTYDANKNANQTIDALSHVTDNDYDPLNRLASTLQDVGGINAETEFAYDAMDNLVKVTDPDGLDTKYAYNSLGDLTQLTSPDTGIADYTYDSAGNRAAQSYWWGDVRFSYGYDALNRLTSITYPQDTTSNATFVYDFVSPCLSTERFIGHLGKMTDYSGVTQYCYDRFGRMVFKSQTRGTRGLYVRYSYTASGQISNVIYPYTSPQVLVVVDYQRDAQGRVTQIGLTQNGVRQVLLNVAGYFPFGPPASWTYGNGRLLQRGFNLNYQPATFLDSASGGLSVGYEFDPVGNVTKLNSGQLSNPPLAGYGYDALHRLSDVKDGPTGIVIEHYDYSGSGDRLGVTNAGVTDAYAYRPGTHQLSQVGAVPRYTSYEGLTYAIGSMSNPDKQYFYDGANRLSSVDIGSTTAVQYISNGKGERVYRNAGGVATSTMYDEAGHWLGNFDATSGSPLQQAIWLDDVPVALLVGSGTSSKVYYIEADALGTPRTVIDPVRNVAVWRWDFQGEAFGSTPPNEDPDGDGTHFVLNMRYPGQQYDPASGLSYNYFRDYEPEIGRYIQSDPIGLRGGLSSYAYVGSSPANFYDANGLSPCKVVTKNEWLGQSFERPTQVGISEQLFEICIPIPRLPSVPSWMDAVPNPNLLLRGEFPLGPATDLKWFCGWIWKDRMRLDRVQRMIEHHYEECTDGCGRRTVKELEPSFTEHVELIRYYDSPWRDDNLNSLN